MLAIREMHFIFDTYCLMLFIHATSIYTYIYIVIPLYDCTIPNDILLSLLSMLIAKMYNNKIVYCRLLVTCIVPFTCSVNGTGTKTHL